MRTTPLPLTQGQIKYILDCMDIGHYGEPLSYKERVPFPTRNEQQGLIALRDMLASSENGIFVTISESA